VPQPRKEKSPAANRGGQRLETERANSARDGASAPPALPTPTLPKGGGAIRGIGEKFAANAVTGTGSMSVPLLTSPGRSGFGPQLSLSYDSGSGNGPFGFGWSLSAPAITRKTEKGLPQYRDAEESDVYLLSGAEDLVPVLRADGSRFEDDASAPGFIIHRYRPRIEGLFARIERWTSQASGEIHWRSITRDNVTTLYGKAAESRITDPGGTGNVFAWLICASHDDKGNAVVYRYVAENGDGVDPAQANERNRVRTANRYLKSIQYGNRTSLLVQPDLSAMEWLFEVVFDYDEDHYEEVALDPSLLEAAQHRLVLASISPGLPWTVRPDPFSSYRAGFEVRTYRRCRRLLTFHRFAELGSEPTLVRSTDFAYADLDYSQPVTIEAELACPGSTRFASLLRAVVQSGFVRDDSRPVVQRGVLEFFTYRKKSLPPLEFEYSKAIVQDDVRELDAGSLENLPAGLDGATYQWIDLDGEGVSGMLTEQATAWFYKPSLGDGRFAPLQEVVPLPALAALSGGRQQLLDLAGDGHLDLVDFAGPTPGFYARTAAADWQPFKAFNLLPDVPWKEPNLRFVDLDGDGHADLLITEDRVFTWYPSLADEGFGPARKVFVPPDEEKGPRLVLADGTQSIYLADMSGDGLTDLVRVRNGEVCYWPNAGYGRFGPKITLDDAPWFDEPDQFNQYRVRLADVDGSGTTDVIYLGRDGVRLYFNQAGNRLSQPRKLSRFPPTDNLSGVMTADLLGNGTTCLVWSSPLPHDARAPMRYIDLMGGQKPYLLIGSINNLGAETRIHYAPSTKFYLADKLAGTPWVTKIPFPVQVVERVETYDRVSGNLFVTRHAYHHGYFDGVEREFRGFGRTEQWDTEEFAALNADQHFPTGTNVEASSHVPPVHTRTWFHTGAYLGADLVTKALAAEYYREAGLTAAEVNALLLDDTALPGGLTIDEEREACRALKGSMLRQEVYALDGTVREGLPYTVSEQNFDLLLLQPKSTNRHAVFLTHPRETITYHYERSGPPDPRVSHDLTLEVDTYGNVRKSAAVGYGRRQPDPALEPRDQARQGALLATWTENEVTNPVDAAGDYRAPLPSETRNWELTGLALPAGRARFTFDEVLTAGKAAAAIGYEQAPAAGTLQKRLIEQVRTLYRGNDLAAPLPLGELASLALPFESYKLAFTPGLVTGVFGGRATATMLAGDGGYVHSEGDAQWWIPSGRVFYSPDPADAPAQELLHAQAHFFLPLRARDPFHTALVSTEMFVRYDAYDLLPEEIRDALGNRTTVGERNADPTLPLVRYGQDYRVLQPALVMDPNRNRSAVAFDALGMVAGTAVMGKPLPAATEGDSLDGFEADLTAVVIGEHLANPLTDPGAILHRATTRLVYDLSVQPAAVYTLARETHDADLAPGETTKVQHGFAYSDGFGREIQKKVQAEPGPAPQRDAGGKVIVGPDGQPEMTAFDVSPRWVGTGWTVLNNKGRPVRQYEPFFTDTHHVEFDVRIGVSPVLFYDPVERPAGTLHPHHAWEKAVFDPWRQETWDVNDTVLAPDPKADPDVGSFFQRLPGADFLPTWFAQRDGGARGPQEKDAADKAAIHRETPLVAHFDPLGRAFLTLAHNRFKRSDSPPADPPVEELDANRIVFDIEGNHREVLDAADRAVMRYDYDVHGNRIHQASMEAGERWTLHDVLGSPLYSWDSRSHRLRTAYDPLRRPTGVYLSDAGGPESLVVRTDYGDTLANAEILNWRGKVVRISDQAGAVTSDEYDFKGNLLKSDRQLAQEYKQALDWSAAVALEPALHTSRTSYDALNRPAVLTMPEATVIHLSFNEASLLERIDVNPRGAAVAAPFVTNIDYDARRRRTRIDYGTTDGMGISTAYLYDRETFRLTDLVTRRDAAAFDGTDRPGEVQSLHYTYDPAGNVTHIRDDAQQTVYFSNHRVEPSADYTYDALYRLIEATGREHLGQSAGSPNPPTAPDAFNGFHAGLAHPGDGNAMGIYFESYVYDAAGNILSVRHRGSDPASPGWKRGYSYGEASQLEAGKVSNRLSGTALGAVTETYHYDSPAGLHGNITAMPHLPLMQWDYRDQLQATARQVVGGGGVPETTWYVYDAQGQRVRKVTERALTAARQKERIYLAGFEIYREYGSDGATVDLERETVHVMDDQRRIALVETRTDTPVPQQLIRYQFGNHLGSASLELDDQAAVISYEEYFPYGSTSYQAVRSQTEASKRYRYTGKERDEETGLNYHQARYYAPWLGRWTTADPGGLIDGPNLYAYAAAAPTSATDPTGKESDADLPAHIVRPPRSPADVQAEARQRQVDEERKKGPRAAPGAAAKKQPAEKVEKEVTPADFLALAKSQAPFTISKEERAKLGLSPEQVDFIVRYFLVATAVLLEKKLPLKNAALLVAHTGVETSFGALGPNPKGNNFLSLQPPPALEEQLKKQGVDVPKELRENRNKEGKLVAQKTPSPHFKDIQQSLVVQIDLVFGLNPAKGVPVLFGALGPQLRSSEATAESYGTTAARAGYAGFKPKSSDPSDKEKLTPEQAAYPGKILSSYDVVVKVLGAALGVRLPASQRGG
jgi:RHS repeat-associated protein